MTPGLDRQNKLWEGSRMFLPEHREALLRHYQKSKKIAVPQLDEQQWEYIHFKLQEAWTLKQQVQLTYVTTYEHRRLIWYIDKIDRIRKMICVMSEDGDEKIPFHTLIHVEVL